MADALGKVGKALPLIAFAFDTYIQYREEKAKEEKVRFLATLRHTLRNTFADQASVEAALVETALSELATQPVAAALKEIDVAADAVCKQNMERSDLVDDVAGLKRQCTALRSMLYAAEPLAQKPVEEAAEVN